MRTSRSAAVVLPGRPVVLAARVLHDGAVAGGQPVRLERRADGSAAWSVVRTGTTRADGLVAWTLRPDRGGVHRVVVGEVRTPALRVDVRQVVRTSVRRSGSTLVTDVVVQPGGRTAVALQVRSARGWATVARATTDTAGRTRFARSLPRGTVVRVVASPRTGLLSGSGTALRG